MNAVHNGFHPPGFDPGACDACKAFDANQMVAAAIVKRARAGEQAARDAVGIAIATPALERSDFQSVLIIEACKPGTPERRELKFGASGWSF